MAPHQLKILEEDNDIIVCLKPAGIPVQTARIGQQDMESLLKNYRALRGEEPEIHVVHRLDQPVEGVMVFAKNQKAAASLAGQFQKRTVDKVYHALVEGTPDPMEGELMDYLLRDGRANTSKAVGKGVPGAKRAALAYRVLERREGQSLVEIRLETGRHHQIRVQMAHACHPLVGDRKYNPHCGPGSGGPPLQLRSVQLSFLHPATGRKKEYNYPNEP